MCYKVYDSTDIDREFEKLGLKKVWEYWNPYHRAPFYEAIYETPYGNNAYAYLGPGVKLEYDSYGKITRWPFWRQPDKESSEFEKALNQALEWLKYKLERDVEINKGSFI